MPQLETPYRRLLWSMAYRVTGCAADADEIVQESYVRALEHPPKGEERPYLVRIAMNLARDRVRRRRTEGYRGPFVPSPIEEEPEPEEMSPQAKYDLKESASLAFLTALEALSAKARAVLVLRDVFDLSVEDTAKMLEMSEANVKVAHHRARRILERYVRPERAPEKVQLALQMLVAAIAAGDAESVKTLLADDAVCMQDAGGEFFAAGIELHGPERITKALIGITKHSAPITNIELRVLNGMPAIIADTVPPHDKIAPRWVISCDVGASGKITRIYTVLATRKLTAISSKA